MYSLMMMAAVTTAPQGMEFNGYFRDRLFGGGGCASTSCCGGGVFQGRILRAFSFGGGSCTGCTGTSRSTGCSGTASAPPPTGCCGGYAYAPPMGCSGSVAFSCSGGVIDHFPTEYAGCSGGGMQAPIYGGMPMMPYGASPTMPYDSGPMPTISPPGVPFAPNSPAPVIDDRGYRANSLPITGGVRGTVIVRLPVDAKLYAEGRLLNLTSAERTFVTPELPPGREYPYTFKIEYTRGGETLTQSKAATVAPGKTTVVEFADLVIGKAPTKQSTDTVAVVPTAQQPAERARITVKLPPGATLYIDQKKNEKAGEVREFTTPPLPTGKEYAYTMRVEMMRNGLPYSVEEKVPFRAGEIVNRDFANALAAR